MENSARANIGEASRGSLFSGDLLSETIAGAADWLALDDAVLDDFEASFRALFDRFPVADSPNESQTEDDLIWPVLDRLGWTSSLRQQNLTLRGRDTVPDGLLFADDAAKVRANGLAEEWKRYELGLAVVESKRWLRPLDRRSGGSGEGIAPSTQMLRYLRRVDDLTSGHLRWGILTNGARWRLYYQGARSVSEQFFEIDLAALLDIPGHNEDLFALTEPERRHGLKLFILFFRREAFLPGDADSRTLHQRALEEGRFHQERVAANLSDLVFGRVFPDLARAIAGEAPDAPLGEVRDAALVILYRLLFILYAEDRDLLPIRDERYDDYGLRDKVRGDVNLYSLFVERAMGLVSPTGVVGLLTPSGIASDKTAAPFFRSVATEGRLRALYDFENRRIRYDLPPFFPDVDSRFKFCAFVAGRSPTAEPARCAFFLQGVGELHDSGHRFPLTPEDFAAVNPNTGTAPIFRTRRDAELTTAIYRRLPVLVDRAEGEEGKTWKLKYSTMFHMTNDSHLFRTREELEEQEGAWPIGDNRFDSAAGVWVPLYEGKMVQAFDHRAASIVIRRENLHRPAQPEPATPEQHRDPNWLPGPQYWVAATECGWDEGSGWVLGFKEITAPTNVRTFIAALLPSVGFGNKVPILRPGTVVGRVASRNGESARTGDDGRSAPRSGPSPNEDPLASITRMHPERREWLLAGNLNATIFDFITRQKVQGQTLNLFIVEQLPVVPPERYEHVRFGPKTADEIVREAVLEFTYTANDMAPFARDLGYVDEAGVVKPPFRWDEERRLRLRAKLDAVFFHLYGVTDRDDIRYVYSTFPIVERQETAEYGRYRSRDLCLAYLNALSAGRPDAEPDL